MGIVFQIFWIIIVVSAFLPMFKQRRLERARLTLHRSIEKERGSRLITLIHRQESMSFLGFALRRFIDIEDSEQILRAIRFTPANMPIDLILHTPGGLVLASEQIANAIKRHPGKVTVFIPHYAMSGGVLIALAADEIVVDENAVLGPVDPQIGSYPAASVVKVLEQKDVNRIDDETLILIDVAKKALSQVEQTVFDILKDKLDEGKAKELAALLSQGHWTHDYTLSCQKLQELGLNVICGLPRRIYELMDLYPQPAQRRSSVEYIPVPYRGGESESAEGNSDSLRVWYK
ncbi:MAG: ATP-dependent Clp protease proteolytic subunit [Limnochordia bacterium]|nr:ATP-dependent Clp protease proteolytic subunit [Limnochordia bacterium]MDD2630806.1 ATP-dependent Clp protease proteolytic subunit [Limnochordia bacterium]MDD4518315.1 ATP-dependent Clp protease proteolytic subunit [Limnochordia bacterium]